MRRIALLLAVTLGAPAAAAPDPGGDAAEVYIIEPADGATVSNPVRVVFGLKGMGVAPAGVNHPNTGHHHLIIDAPAPPPGKPIPADDRHRHFGAGQTETRLILLPGKHTLQLVMGDHVHFPHEPPVVSKRITVTVR
jgi:hypothetical protein